MCMFSIIYRFIIGFCFTVRISHRIASCTGLWSRKGGSIHSNRHYPINTLLSIQLGFTIHTNGLSTSFTKQPKLNACVVCSCQARQRDAFVQERYGQYDLSDPFLALQRDNKAAEHQQTLTQPHAHLQGRAVGPNPLAVLKLVMTHCRRMQERMMGQLAAAESRHRRVNGKSHPYVPTEIHVRLNIQQNIF